jgi:hypothetical protein
VNYSLNAFNARAKTAGRTKVYRDDLERLLTSVVEGRVPREYDGSNVIATFE